MSAEGICAQRSFGTSESSAQSRRAADPHRLERVGGRGHEDIVLLYRRTLGLEVAAEEGTAA